MINLPKNPKINQIPIAVRQLQDLKFDLKKLLDNSLLYKINPDQFVFLMGIAAYSGKNFDFNMRFLKTYITRINKSESELLLKIELILHEIFIKNHPSEKKNKYIKFTKKNNVKICKLEKNSNVFNVLKKLSATALSQQFPFLLILLVIL